MRFVPEVVADFDCKLLIYSSQRYRTLLSALCTFFEQDKALRYLVSVQGTKGTVNVEELS
ncbi:hypothetical protein M513_08374 [Trichuris suis]|uniref:Uncharacterized protein n=1 Tax=Trichuris suis TaxID=68888 RepID=A0A085M0H2_9BILA|nr:hypothetical protein M513_08374 [Trichuris suis]